MEVKDNKKPTIIRVLLAIAAMINNGAIATGIASFENPMLDYWYKIISFIFTAVVMVIGVYYNNDFTEEGAEGTAYTRRRKLENKNVIFEDEDTEVDDE